MSQIEFQSLSQGMIFQLFMLPWFVMEGWKSSTGIVIIFWSSTTSFHLVVWLFFKKNILARYDWKDIYWHLACQNIKQINLGNGQIGFSFSLFIYFLFFGGGGVGINYQRRTEDLAPDWHRTAGVEDGLWTFPGSRHLREIRIFPWNVTFKCR